MTHAHRAPLQYGRRCRTDMFQSRGWCHNMSKGCGQTLASMRESPRYPRCRQTCAQRHHCCRHPGPATGPGGGTGEIKPCCRSSPSLLAGKPPPSALTLRRHAHTPSLARRSPVYPRLGRRHASNPPWQPGSHRSFRSRSRPRGIPPSDPTVLTATDGIAETACAAAATATTSTTSAANAACAAASATQPTRPSAG